jgi:hypothetical protein
MVDRLENYSAFGRIWVAIKKVTIQSTMYGNIPLGMRMLALI